MNSETKYLVVALVLLGAKAWAASEFRPGQVWLDANGQPIQAHSAGFLVRSNTYYWYGEDRTPGRRTSVSCYSSTNLYDWRHEGVVLPNEALPARVVERPKVIFNSRTGKYVMWMHLEQGKGYNHSRAGIALSDTPVGPFTFLDQMRPITNDFGYKENDPARQKEFGGTYRDMSLFLDDDARAYAFYASEGNATMYVVRLNQDFTGPETPVVQDQTWARILVGKSREAPAPFKWNRRYYLITSGCTGWAANAADYAVADHILGPYESKGNPCVGADADKTFGAQSTFVLPVTGQPGCFIFMADRWSPRQLSDSRYVWLPLLLKPDGSLTLEWRDQWDLSLFQAKAEGKADR